jgi:general secretion pathway protein D
MQQAEIYATQNQWLKAVLEYRKAVAKNPGDVGLRSRLKQTELKAADYYYQQGLKFVERNDIDGAIVQFQQGLVAKPDHSKLVQTMNDVMVRKEATELYQQALNSLEVGMTDEAIHLLEQALEKHPDYQKAKKILERLVMQREERTSDKLALSSTEPVTLNFRKTDIKTAFEFIAKSFGINVIFDSELKKTSVSLFAKDVTFEQALHLMLTTTKTFYRRLGPNSILIAPDTKDKRGQYEDYIIRIFQLKTTKAKDMATIIKSVLSLKKITINESLNTLIIRDTKDALALCEKIILANDRKPAELILDVEILEVNRTKTEQLGFDFGSEITLSHEPFTGSWSNAFRSGVVTLPLVSFNYFKQDVDAKTLANPKVRVIDDKPAKIHIGDRVPLRASTVLDATGQTRTTYEYRDIGIKLTVLPEIHVDNSVTVKLGLEVSTLGSNLGTTDEPAFSIGTRNADTFMLLRDGETAILGGLIRDEDRNTLQRVPGLGDIPVVGYLFSQTDNTTSRTDVLLTITPRVVRSWDFPHKRDSEIFSGTEKALSTQPLFAYMDKQADEAKGPSISLESQDKADFAVPSATEEHSIGPKAKSDKVVLRFAEGEYVVKQDGTIEIGMVAEGLDKIKNIPMQILLNPQLLEFIEVERSGLDSKVSVQQESGGIVKLEYTDINVSDSGPVSLGKLKLKGLTPGVSYIVYRALPFKGADDSQVRTQVRATRVTIN